MCSKKNIPKCMGTGKGGDRGSKAESWENWREGGWLVALSWEVGSEEREEQVDGLEVVERGVTAYAHHKSTVVIARGGGGKLAYLREDGGGWVDVRWGIQRRSLEEGLG